MPRDITHWLVAQAVVDRVAETELGRLAAQRTDLLMLGAIGPDALFYLPPGRPKRYLQVGLTIHDQAEAGEFPVLDALAEHWIAAGYSAEAAAFLVGAVSHIATDQAFHPWIYAATGQPPPDKKAISRVVQAHYRLEAAIDLHFLAATGGRLADYSLGRWLRTARADLEPLLAVMGRIYLEPDDLAGFTDAALASFDRYAKAQAVFKLRPLAGAAYVLRGLAPDKIREIICLGYAPQLNQLLPGLGGEQTFSHPVSGKSVTTDLATMFDQAMAAALARLELDPKS